MCLFGHFRHCSKVSISNNNKIDRVQYSAKAVLKCQGKRDENRGLTNLANANCPISAEMKC